MSCFSTSGSTRDVVTAFSEVVFSAAALSAAAFSAAAFSAAAFSAAAFSTAAFSAAAFSAAAFSAAALSAEIFSPTGFSTIGVFGRIFFSSFASKGCFSGRLTSSCFTGAEDILSGTGEILKVGSGANLFDRTADSA
ncbi:MAG: pentapeptide repeat-containing protein [Deltaproteobacteria bacterium]|nr:pentapeptide repeat-containing protein [Deltaproteobacteria bacterium]